MKCQAALWLLLLAACGDARLAELELRVQQLEQQLQQKDALLQQHGIRTYDAPAKDAGERAARAVAALQDALAELERAKDTRDTGRGQAAMTAIDQTLQQLREQREMALPALLTTAQSAPAPQQPALLECYARVGGAGVSAQLQTLLADAAQSPGLRQQAGRSLLECDPAAGLQAVHDLLRGRTAPLPELFMLVHLVAATNLPDAVPVLIEALQTSQDRSVRCHAATGLAGYATAAAGDALAAAVTGDEYPAVRANALRALSRIDASRAAALAPAVLQKEQDPALRAAATAAQAGR